MSKIRCRKVDMGDFEEMLKEIPLERRLFVSLQMDDYQHWQNGDYNGDIDKLKDQVKHIVRIVNEWVNDGMPKD